MEYKMQRSTNQQQSGAVSLFVVIFSALLITIITVSFIRIMNQEQQAALTNDLSQSAYDSALAGVEDAKRVLLAAQEGDPRSKQAIEAKGCDTISRAGVVGETTTDSNRETIIQTETAGGAQANKLNQAYTCVIINMATNDYLAEMQADQSILVPLKAEDPISKVRISWLLQSKDDIGVNDAQAALESVSANVVGGNAKLPNAESWGESAPALMRAQIISPEQSADDRNFSLSDLDDSEVTQTVFLYPATAGSDSVNMASMNRRDDSGGNEPTPIACSIDSYRNGQYLCSTTLNLRREIPTNSEVAHLRLSALYNKSSVQIQLLNDSGDPVKFNGVQPMVDSTGRANDIFRRVESRLSLGLPDFAYPEAAVDIYGSLCKDFYVTDEEAGYAGEACKPY